MHNVLIVDDETCWIESHKNIIDVYFPGLINYNFASSAAEALDTISKDQPDLLITDLVMEKMDTNIYAGEFLVNTVKRKYPTIKVIIVSGSADIEQVAKRTKANAYVSKVFQNTYFLKLKAKIANLLQIKTQIC